MKVFAAGLVGVALVLGSLVGSAAASDGSPSPVLAFQASATATATPVPASTPEPETEDDSDLNVDGDASSDGEETTLETTVTVESSLTNVPTEDADQGNSSGGPVVATDAVTVSAPSASGRIGDCINYLPELRDEEGNVLAPFQCTRWQVCGQERVDDIVSGNIAAQETTGRYRDFLFGVAGLINSPTPSTPSTPQTGADNVNDVLVDIGLTDPPTTAHIPVFNWCATHTGDNVLGFPDIASSSLGWGLTFDDVYDIPGDLTALYDELSAKLALYVPDVGLVPPVDQGRTFVQWPTWMFLNNPLEEEFVFSDNGDINTLRLEMRARLIGINWSWGGQTLRDCLPGEMEIFTETSDPIEDLPACHYIFTQTGNADLTTTITYQIEQRVLTRTVATDPYPNPPWTPFIASGTATPTIELDSTIDNYRVNEILALNVAPGLTTDQARQTFQADN